MFPLLVKLQLTVLSIARHAGTRLRHLRAEDGQTSAEYALVCVGAGLVAALLIGWARSSGKIGDLLDTVVDQVIDQVG